MLQTATVQWTQPRSLFPGFLLRCPAHRQSHRIPCQNQWLMTLCLSHKKTTQIHFTLKRNYSSLCQVYGVIFHLLTILYSRPRWMRLNTCKLSCLGALTQALPWIILDFDGLQYIKQPDDNWNFMIICYPEDRFCNTGFWLLQIQSLTEPRKPG